MQNLKKILPKLFILIILTIVVIIVIFSLNDITEILDVLKNIEVSWLLIAFLFLFIYMLFYPMPLYFLGRSKTEPNISLLDTALIGSMEYFFNGLTPFAAGGQPFQVYAYRKVGVSLDRASGIILMNFVISQIAIVLLCLGSLFFFTDLTKGTLHLEIMIIIGLSINVLILVLFCSVGLSSHIRNLLIRFVNFIIHRKLFKGKFDHLSSAFESYCKGAQDTFKALLSQKLKFFLCIIVKWIGLIFFYMIPFFILKALRIEVGVNQLLLITAMTTFSVAMTNFIPTPGATGGIEFAFQSLFVSVIPSLTSSTATSGLLLWRFITYYFLMFVSFLIYILFEQICHRKLKKNIEEENKIL